MRLTELKDRIKAVRESAKLSQSRFAEQIHVKQPTVAGYESGRSAPGDAIIASICRLYGVNELWLRYGDGEMHQPLTIEEELTDVLADLLKGSEESKKRLILALAKLPEEWYEQFEECVIARFKET